MPGREPFGRSSKAIPKGPDPLLANPIRAILMKDSVARVQSGAGIGYDSVPSKEYEETVNKAKVALKALEMAGSGEV